MSNQYTVNKNNISILPDNSILSSVAIGSGGSGGSGSLFSTINSPFRSDSYVECADIKISGQSLKTALEDINKRLLILVPDPAHLEKHEQLRAAYDQYKILEALLTSQ